MISAGAIAHIYWWENETISSSWSPVYRGILNADRIAWSYGYPNGRSWKDDPKLHRQVIYDPSR